MTDQTAVIMGLRLSASIPLPMCTVLYWASAYCRALLLRDFSPSVRLSNVDIVSERSIVYIIISWLQGSMCTHVRWRG